MGRHIRVLGALFISRKFIIEILLLAQEGDVGLRNTLTHKHAHTCRRREREREMLSSALRSDSGVSSIQ